MLYFDNAATSFPKAPKVAQTVFDYIQNVGANAGRGSYSSSIVASELLFEVKENIAQLFNIKNEERIVMTSGATESLNTVIMGFLRKGMTVLTSNMEHNSVLRPLNYLAQQQIIDLYKFDITEGLKDFENKLSLNPDLVIVTAASNVTGEIYPITEIGKLVSTQNALFCVDAAQSAGLSPIDVAKSQIDFLCAAGHKGLIGPTGTGFLYIKNGIELKTFKYGGTGSNSDSEFQPDFMPDKFESGTMNLSGIAGLNSSLKYILKKKVTNLFKEKIELNKYFLYKLKKCKELTNFSKSNPENQVGVFSVVPNKISISHLTHQLDKNDIAVRMGFHCSPSAHQAIGTTKFGGTVRFSLGYSHTKKDIDKLFAILSDILD